MKKSASDVLPKDKAGTNARFMSRSEDNTGTRRTTKEIAGDEKGLRKMYGSQVPRDATGAISPYRQNLINRASARATGPAAMLDRNQARAQVDAIHSASKKKDGGKPK
jgi:hypothetical protein